MPHHAYLTVGQVAEIYRIPAWKIRRVVDSLDVEIPRAGLYRLIPNHLLDAIGTELHQQNWLPRQQGGESCS